MFNQQPPNERPRYTVLPAGSATRQQYEAAPPTGWQMIQLDIWIAEYEQQLEALEEQGLKANDRLPALERTLKQLEKVNAKSLPVYEKANHDHALKEAREAWVKGKSAREGARKEYQRLSALLAAAEMWRAEGKSLRGGIFDHVNEQEAAA